jgi:hypothetical protein
MERAVANFPPEFPCPTLSKGRPAISAVSLWPACIAIRCSCGLRNCFSQLGTLNTSCESLYRAGFRKLLMINGHGGQPQILQIACREMRLRHAPAPAPASAPFRYGRRASPSAVHAG